MVNGSVDVSGKIAAVYGWRTEEVLSAKLVVAEEGWDVERGYARLKDWPARGEGCK